MITTVRFSIFAMVLALNAAPALAAERIDYDIDDDGLIEIEDLQDLNEIGNNITITGVGDYPFQELRGDTLYGVSDGCPQDGCNGYELIKDLNFDTNGNGELDEGDTYWNEGKGWDPIGSFWVKFVADFNGNGYTLHNLAMNRPGEPWLGLFSYSEQAHIHDFSLTANLITGAESGGVIGFSWKTTFENLYLDVAITGESVEGDCNAKCDPIQIGGIVGVAEESDFNNIVLKANITGLNWLGGLVGLAYGSANSQINEVAMQATITGQNFIGALAGDLNSYQVKSVVAVAHLNGLQNVGALIGGAEHITLSNVLVSGALNEQVGLSDYSNAGGFIGGAVNGSLANVISLIRMPADPDEDHNTGALMAYAQGLTIDQVYWAQDLAQGTRAHGNSSQYITGRGFDLVDIQCATLSEGCNGMQLTGFDEPVNSQGQALWDFGNNQQAPMMALAVGTFGDADGDGEMDDWPAIDAPIVPDPRGNPAQNNNSDSPLGLGGVFYLCWLLVPLMFRRR